MFFLSTKLVSKTTKSLVYHSKRSSKRGVGEIIGTLILMGVTVTGGLLVWTLFQGSEQLTFSLSEIELSPIVIAQLKVTGYDTRDAASLYDIANIDNGSGGADFLCTTCGATNEFIILKIRNDNDEAVFINEIEINEVLHVFDSLHTTGAPTFTGAHDDDGDGLGGTLPEAGEYIIISGSGNTGIIQEKGAAIPIGGEKRFVIRLGDLPTNDPTDNGITLNSQFRVIINSSVETIQELLIPAGSLA